MPVMHYKSGKKPIQNVIVCKTSDTSMWIPKMLEDREKRGIARRPRNQTSGEGASASKDAEV